MYASTFLIMHSRINKKFSITLYLRTVIFDSGIKAAPMLIPASLPHEIFIETGSTTGKTFESFGGPCRL